MHATQLQQVRYRETSVPLIGCVIVKHTWGSVFGGPLERGLCHQEFGWRLCTAQLEVPLAWQSPRGPDSTLNSSQEAFNLFHCCSVRGCSVARCKGRGTLGWLCHLSHVQLPAFPLARNTLPNPKFGTNALFLSV